MTATSTNTVPWRARAMIFCRASSPSARSRRTPAYRDRQFDRNGFQRDSNGGYAKVGTSFEFTRLLTGEASVGYAARSYADPSLTS